MSQKFVCGDCGKPCTPAPTLCLEIVREDRKKAWRACDAAMRLVRRLARATDWCPVCDHAMERHDRGCELARALDDA